MKNGRRGERSTTVELDARLRWRTGVPENASPLQLALVILIQKGNVDPVWIGYWRKHEHLIRSHGDD